MIRLLVTLLLLGQASTATALACKVTHSQISGLSRWTPMAEHLAVSDMPPSLTAPSFSAEAPQALLGIGPYLYPILVDYGHNSQACLNPDVTTLSEQAHLLCADQIENRFMLLFHGDLAVTVNDFSVEAIMDSIENPVVNLYRITCEEHV